MTEVKFMTKFSVKKILILIILIAIVLNLGWFLITTYKYHKFVEVIPKNEWGLHFIEKDGFMYSVKKPDYLTLTGNLAVDNKEGPESLIIWPLITGGYEYGFMLEKDGESYQFYVDENLEPIDKDDTIAIQKIEEYKDELEGLLSKANEMWQLE